MASLGEQEFLKGAETLDLPIERRKLILFRRYFHLLDKWNKIYNLTGIKNTARWWTHHFLDCLALQKYISGSSLVDVGSGAGFPGIVLAITNPQKKITLLDSNQKKYAFLQEVSTNLGLSNLEVVLSRVEDFYPTTRFSCVVSRAFSSLDIFLKKTSHLCKEEGFLVAMKGQLNKIEMDSLPANSVKEIIPLGIPFVLQKRNVVFMAPILEKEEL